MDVNRILSAAANIENDIKYLVSENTQKESTGFYLGDTDNFGHWLFEFLPKVLWYKRLFPNHDLPLIIGESVPEKWLELLEPFGIEKNPLKGFHQELLFVLMNLYCVLLLAEELYHQD